MSTFSSNRLLVCSYFVSAWLIFYVWKMLFEHFIKLILFCIYFNSRTKLIPQFPIFHAYTQKLLGLNLKANHKRFGWRDQRILSPFGCVQCQFVLIPSVNSFSVRHDSKSFCFYRIKTSTRCILMKRFLEEVRNHKLKLTFITNSTKM